MLKNMADDAVNKNEPTLRLSNKMPETGANEAKQHRIISQWKIVFRDRC